MARGKDAPAITGGQIDPYVASTMQQNKQQAQNRLLTAMQERGATERAGIAAGAQLGTQQMRSETALQVQAAQSAADDKRAAEAERGRREDKKYADFNNKATKEFQANESKLNRDHITMLQQGRYDEAKLIREEIDAIKSIEMRLDYRRRRDQDNFLATIITGSQNKEEASEKLLTSSMAAEESDTHDGVIYRRGIEAGEKRLRLGNLGNRSVEKKFETSIDWGGGQGGWGIPTKYEESTSYAGKRASGVVALQDELSKNEAKITVNDLELNNAEELKQKMIRGEITFAEVNSTSMSIESVLSIMEERMETATVKELKLWTNDYEEIIGMRNVLEDLRFSDDKIAGGTQTIGEDVVKRGLSGKYPQYARGNRLAEIRRQTGDINEAFLKKLTESRGGVELEPIDYINDSPATIRAKEKVNSAAIDVYPELKDSETYAANMKGKK